jgi:hypothetical protein
MGKMIKRADGSYSQRGLWDSIRKNKGSGKKPTKQMLEQEAKIKAKSKYADGGIKLKFDNSQNEIDQKTGKPTGRGGLEDASWEALQAVTGAAALGKAGKLAYDAYRLSKPGIINLSKTYYPTYNKALKEVGKALLPFAEGGKIPNSVLKSRLESHMSPEEVNEYMANYGKGGYVVKRSNDRKGKTHVVIGPDGTKKYFGDPNMGEKENSKNGKEAFYARHKHNLANNPYFRAYARKTWGEGGTIGQEFDEYAEGGTIHIKPENKGKFTSWAKSHGMGVQEAASHVMANKNKYSSTVVKRANFAKNASKWHHALGGIAKYPGGGETEGGMTTIPVTNKFYNQPLANQTTEIANYASANPNVKAGTFSVLNNTQAPVNKPVTTPLGYDNQKFTPSVDTNSLPLQYNKKDWGQQYVPSVKSNYYTYYPTGQTYTPEQYNTYKNTMQPTTAALPTNAMGGYVPKYSYVNGKFIPTHGFGDTTVGAGIKEGGAIAPTLQFASSFVGDNNSPLGQALDYGAQGASAGMMFGPWGAAIGGGLGLAGGAIKGYMDQEEQAKKQREYDQQKKNASTYAQLMGKGPQSNLSVKTNNQALYAAGGMKVISRNHPNPQEEVEGGETAITPNGRNIQFRGPKHNNGGIKTNLPAGTRIFSDRIVYPG